MKKLLVLIFSIFISLNSYGDWKEFGEISEGNFYINTDTIQEKGGYVYWWEMFSSINIYDENGHKSNQIYRLGDCQMARDKPVFYLFYFGSMGNDLDYQDSAKDPDWYYSPPGTIAYNMLNFVCDYVK